MCLSIENAARNHNKMFPEPPVYAARSKVAANLDHEARITVAATSCTAGATAVFLPVSDSIKVGE